MPQVEVEAYAGTSYPERPLRVRWLGGWRRVLRVEHQRQEPDRRCFSVLLEPLPADGRGDIRLRLCYHYANDAWQAERLAGHLEDQHT
ncbi:MAG: hypothetical protein HYY03_02160 [Chloroflexi bacterium]|nr:hypothetical protein [Chloroflexota bacterium]